MECHWGVTEHPVSLRSPGCHGASSVPRVSQSILCPFGHQGVTECPLSLWSPGCHRASGVLVVPRVSCSVPRVSQSILCPCASQGVMEPPPSGWSSRLSRSMLCPCSVTECPLSPLSMGSHRAPSIPGTPLGAPTSKEENPSPIRVPPSPIGGTHLLRTPITKQERPSPIRVTSSFIKDLQLQSGTPISHQGCPSPIRSTHHPPGAPTTLLPSSPPRFVGGTIKTQLALRGRHQRCLPQR